MTKYKLYAKFTGGHIHLDYDNLVDAKARADEIRKEGFILKIGDRDRDSDLNQFVEWLFYPLSTLEKLEISRIETER